MKKLYELSRYADFVKTDSDRPYEPEFERGEMILLEKYLFAVALALGEEETVMRDEFEIKERKAYTNEIVWELYGPYYPFGGTTPASFKVRIAEVSYPYFEGTPLNEKVIFACFRHFAKQNAMTEDINVAFGRWICLMREKYGVKLLATEE